LGTGVGVTTDRREKVGGGGGGGGGTWGRKGRKKWGAGRLSQHRQISVIRPSLGLGCTMRRRVQRKKGKIKKGKGTPSKGEKKQKMGGPEICENPGEGSVEIKTLFSHGGLGGEGKDREKNKERVGGKKER